MLARAQARVVPWSSAAERICLGDVELIVRVLIAGGGVAGLTLAAKLAQQGRKPVVVERSSEYSDTGYAISLYPPGSCVLHGLGVYQELVNRSVETRCYEMRDHKGAMLQDLDLSAPPRRNAWRRTPLPRRWEETPRPRRRTPSN